MPAAAASAKACATVFAAAISAARPPSPPASRATVPRAARSAPPRLECRSRKPCPSLVILATPPATVTRGTGWRRRYFSMPPAKSPISISATSSSPCRRCAARFGHGAGAAGDVGDAGRPRHVDAAVDGVDPGGAGEWHHDAGGAQDRQPADDPEAAVQRALGQALAARHRDRHLGVGCHAAQHFGERVADHPARHRVDRGLAGRQRQAGAGHGADPLAGPEHHPRAGRQRAHARPHQRAVGDVGVVAGVLYDAGLGPVVGAGAAGQRERGGLAAGQDDLHRVREDAVRQRRERRLRRCGGAGAGGPAAAEGGRGQIGPGRWIPSPSSVLPGRVP